MIGLNAWARAHALLSPQVEIAQTSHGLGLRTLSPVSAGAELVRVNATYALTAARALELSPDVARLLESRDVEAHVVLAVWLMRAAERPDALAHAPWLRALPRSLDCTLLWRPEEVALLQASPAAGRAH